MKKLLNYLVLPKEVSPTETEHVKKINRIALIAFFCHIPIFAGVAWLCDTGPLFAIGLSILTLIGPTVAYYKLEDHRTIASIFGFTAMCMGGLLVHFGQGPMQIEMHFYFFVLLALLATYGNPMVNVTAAATAAVHHLALYLLLPNSVFNYDASIWVVAVHALFVVIETVAAVFIARNFYDNVIGLEKIVNARTQEVKQRNKDMRLVLDHVSQGLITIGLDSSFGDERSQKVDAWLGAPPQSGRFIEWLAQVDDKAATWLEIGLEELVDDILPVEIILDQFPKRATKGRGEEKQTFSLSFTPIHDEQENIERLLVVMSDITAELAQAAAEAQQRENLQLFELLGSDASGFEEFFDEANKILRRVIDDPELELKDLKRLVHTLKGNTALFGLNHVSSYCHELEDGIETSGERPSTEDLQSLDLAWRSIEEKVEQLTGGDRKIQMMVQRSDLEELLQAIRDEHPLSELENRVTRMHMEPSHKRIAILAEQAKKIADRLGRDNISVEHSVDKDIRFDGQRWSAFWSSLVHVLRNAVDHGIECCEEREGAGKEGEAHLALKTYLKEDNFVLEIADDGRGIDLARLAEKARAKGMSVDTPEDVLQTIFADGISSKDAISETSGRGVGMSAVKAEAEALGGKVEVATKEGSGTKFYFVFPTEQTSLPPEQVGAN